MVLLKRTKTWADADSASADEVHEQSEVASHAVSQDEIVKLAAHTKKKKGSFFTTGRSLFLLGIIFGTILGLSFIEPGDVQDMHARMLLWMDHYDISFPEIPGLDLIQVEAEWTRFKSSIPEIWKFTNDGREFQVGESMKARGLTAQHPIVLIPGVISTALESWSTSPEYRPFFRAKLWGGFNMVSQVTFNKEKWIAAMMLDPVTGLDPPDAKIRAAEGIDAASSFIQAYWIWSKIIENLAVVNYDTNNLYLSPYDWRLSFHNLEERDGYFSKLKTTIESLKRRQKKKVVLAAHSMGSVVALVAMYLEYWPFFTYFLSFKWVESPQHGAGGLDWVENHIEAYISIAGPHLGVAKAMAAFISGEMKDTVDMNPAGAYVLERFFSRKDRLDLFRSWAGIASLGIKGGNSVWGNMTHAPDDEFNATHSHGELIAFRHPNTVLTTSRDDDPKNMTTEEAGIWMYRHTPATFQKMLSTNYSYGIERNEDVLIRNDHDPTKWTNALEIRLPKAPSMKVYCVYGHGIETERSYWYAGSDDEPKGSSSDGSSDSSSTTRADVDGGPDALLSRRSWIDATYTNETITPKVRNGIKFGEGDGTVNLLSMGAMCVEGWKRPRYNPAGIKTITVELPHRPVLSMPRGGANASAHVDILGSVGLNEIILKVVTGVGHEIQDSYVSNIREYSRKIQWD